MSTAQRTVPPETCKATRNTEVLPKITSSPPQYLTDETPRSSTASLGAFRRSPRSLEEMGLEMSQGVELRGPQGEARPAGRPRPPQALSL